MLAHEDCFLRETQRAGRWVELFSGMLDRAVRYAGSTRATEKVAFAAGSLVAPAVTAATSSLPGTQTASVQDHSL